MTLEKLLCIDQEQPPLMLPFKGGEQWLYWCGHQNEGNAHLDMYASPDDSVTCYVVGETKTYLKE
jgi:hypothetical protein